MAGDTLFGSVPDGWESTTLGEIVCRGGGHIQTGPFGSQLHASDYVPHGVPSIMPVNIGDNRIVEDGIARITEDDATRLARHRVQVGDIIYSRRGDVERRALIRSEQEGWLCGTGCLKVRLGRDVVDPLFASYYLGHPNVRAWIVQHAVGATMPNLNTGIMDRLPFLSPPLTEQRAIACILGALDDKIELNRQRNRTLEAMARAIFQSWFVDFDPVKAKASGRKPPGLKPEIAALFPDRFEDSSLGPVPAGWRVGTLKDVIAVCDSRRIPLSNRQREQRPGPYPYYGAAAQMDSVDDYLFDGVYVLMGEDGSVVKDDGTPVLQYVWGKFWVNNHAHVLQGTGSISTEHLLLHLKSCKIVPFVTGAVQPKLNQGNMNRIGFTHAPELVNRKFSELIAPLFSRMRYAFDESRTLATLRDALLPKLISGELRVPDAERIAGRLT